MDSLVGIYRKTALVPRNRAECGRISFQSTIVTKTTMVERKLVEFDECFAKEELAALIKHNELQADFEKGAELDLVSKRYEDLIAVQFATQQFEQLPENLQADINTLLLEVYHKLMRRSPRRSPRRRPTQTPTPTPTPAPTPSPTTAPTPSPT